MVKGVNSKCVDGGVSLPKSRDGGAIQVPLVAAGRP